MQDVENKAKHKSIKGVTLENRIGQQKSTCVNCDSKKSIFFKKSSFHKLQNMQIYWKNCKKNTLNAHIQKN